MMESSKYQEPILVVKRSILMDQGAWKGIKPVCFDEISLLIQQNREFLPRGAMEEDPFYKQIIPYIIFAYQDRYFLMKRKADATEKRLANLYTLGIGGHVRKEDMEHDSIVSWAEREFHEEINYDGSYVTEVIGLVNDDFVPVGKFHVGLAIIFRGSTENISIKSELQQGRLVPIEECMHFHKDMETWSQLILEYLLDIKYGSASIRCCSE
jgi:predicted NUDIX family phosphoesterase